MWRSLPKNVIFARIGHINHQRTVNIYGDVDAEMANTSEVIKGLEVNFLSHLQQRYPANSNLFD